MRIFVYGTLLDTTALARRAGQPGQPGLAARPRPALLAGYRRVTLRLSRYPTLRRDLAHVTDGAVLDITAAAYRRLAAYEGPRYRLRRLRVGTLAGSRMAPRLAPSLAWVWIAAGATRRDWPPPG